MLITYTGVLQEEYASWLWQQAFDSHEAGYVEDYCLNFGISVDQVRASLLT